MSQIYVLDPTLKDGQSKLRGVGRYMQIIQESFKDEFHFVSSINEVPKTSSFINPFFNPVGTNNIRKRVAQKQIAVIHDVIPLSYPAHFPLGMRGTISYLQNIHALKHYDVIVTDSYRSKDEIVKLLHTPQERIYVIYPTLSSVFIQSSSDEVSPIPKHIQKPYCIYVGDATWNKNLYHLGQAIKKGETPCVFVGKAFTLKPTNNPWQREFVRFHELAHNDERFIFTGFVTDTELINLYKNASLNLLLSYDEGFGFSYLEASSVSCPSLLSDTPIFREIAQEHAYFVSPHHPDSISLMIERLVSSPSNLSLMGTQAQKQSQKYTVEQFKNDWLHILHDI